MRLNFCCASFSAFPSSSARIFINLCFPYLPCPLFPRSFAFYCFWQISSPSKAVLGFPPFGCPFFCICSVFVLVPHIFSGFVLFAAFFSSKGERKHFLLFAGGNFQFGLRSNDFFCFVVAESEEMQESRRKRLLSGLIGSVWWIPFNVVCLTLFICLFVSSCMA